MLPPLQFSTAATGALTLLMSHRKIKCESQRGEDRPYIKRPLNAFMLFAKEQRANIQAKIMTSECKIVSAALGQRVSGFFSLQSSLL